MNIEKIAVISYHTPHRKTQDVLCQLKAKGYVEVTVFALPFVQRPNPFSPIYQHRPSKAMAVDPEVFCNRFGYGFEPTTVDTLHQQLDNFKADFVLIAGAGLLPDALVEAYRMINTHPGFLPFTRGLDSLKWAIHKGVEIGITTHFVDTEADAGFLIEQRHIPLYTNDTFHSVATRQYEIEIEMLVDSLALIPQLSHFPSLSSTEFEATRRMPKAVEAQLMTDFEHYKTRFAK